MKYFVSLALTCFSLFAHSEWVVDTKNSHVGFASVKNKTIAENHRLTGFTSFEGGILLISGSNPTHSKESSSFCRDASLSKKRFLLVSALIT